MDILKLENVGYRYKDANLNDYVLSDINYSFSLGKCYAIKGKSGSGKSTLLSLISGLERPSKGKIYYNNKDLGKIDLDKFRNTNIGIIFQSFNLLPHLNAIENIILSMDISGIKVKNKKEYAIKLLKDVGLTKDHGERRILRLSGGEQQRVAIARSLSYNPDIIIADEPTGNLDEETENEIIEIFKDLAHNQNKCVIIVTHSNNVAHKVDVVLELEKENKSIKKSKRI